MLIALSSAQVGYAAATAAAGNVEEIVVTGSYIKGTPENSAAPVDVITNQDLQDVGNPNIQEFIKDLGIASGLLAETNQFNAPAQGTEGIVTINLRGLGAGRTLTLINGRRQVATESNGVDVSAFPMAAFGRTEILKDAAAVTYGSDAIAGVVNFISREGFEGFEISGSNTWLEESNGNNTISAIGGWAGERMNGFVAAEFDHRSELAIKDKDWGLLPFAQNFNGGWSTTGMPGTTYLRNPAIPVGAASLPGTNQQQFRGIDPQCVPLGGDPALGPCGFQFTFFDNLIEKTNTNKYYGEFNYDVSDSSKFHVEALYSYLDMPHWNSSPGYPPNSLYGPDRIVPANNPGLIQYKADYPALFACVATNTCSATVPLPAGTTIANVQVYQRSRMLGVNGRDGEALSAYREVATWRLGTSLIGEAFDGALGYNFAVTYSNRNRKSNGYDMQVQGMAFALNGLGGPGCTPGGANPATSTAGAGPCQWFNPFSEAIAFSAPKGIANPTFNPTVANSDELINWLTLEASGREINELLVWDAIFNGELEQFELPGGKIGWAAGFQARNEKYQTELSDVANRAVSPCPWTDPFAVTMGFVTAGQLSPNCNIKTGRLAFGIPADNANTSRTVYALFSEFALPITDTLNMQAAVRFEDYGSQGGSTIDPKLALKWQALDWIALRGSISTTFRGPPLSYLSGVNSFLANFPAPLLAYRAVNVVGNPDLQPERAVVFNTGLIVEVGGFTGTADYWNFNFSDPFQTEAYDQVLTAYNAAGCFNTGAGVGSATCNDLRLHVEPLGATTALMEAINVNIINGGKIKTDGVDVSLRYLFSDVMGGELTVGTEATYTIKYDSDDFKTLGGTTLATGGDFVGLMNIGKNPFYPLPDLKGNAFVRFAWNDWRFSYTLRYVGDYTDRAAIGANANLVDVDSFTTQDVTAMYTWKDLNIAASVFNLTDEDPPSAFQPLNYDPYTANPFGRMVKLQLTYTLGAK